MRGVRLAKFDEKFFETIKGYKKVHLKPDECVAYNIIFNNKKAGVIGFKIKEGNNYFLKIGIHQDFRGQGIFAEALNLLAKKHKIRRIYSTVALANAASAKAHKKVGFRRIPQAKQDKLKKQGLLLKRNIRFVKTFK